MGSQTILLNWSNHRKNMSDVFQHLFSTEAFVDVTLACEGLFLKAHKIILSASSQFFETLLLENPCQHPIVILTDMRYSDLTEIVNFIYQGMIEIAQDRLSEFLRTAERLKIKGLSIESGNAGHDAIQAEDHSISDLCARQVQCGDIQSPTSSNGEQLDVHKNGLNSSGFFEANIKLPMPSIKLEHSTTVMESLNREPLSDADKYHSLSLLEYCAASCFADQDSGRNKIPTNNQCTGCSYSTQQQAHAGELSAEGADSQQPFTPTLSKQMTLGSEDNRTKIQADATEVPKLNKDNDVSVRGVLNENNEGRTEIRHALQKQEPFTSKDIFHAMQDYYYTTPFKDSSLHCDVCGKAFESVQNLSRHVRIHSTNQQFSCAICNKSFSKKKSLRIHSRTHSGERPFSCDVCGKTFGQREHLRTHFRIHSGEKPFSCDVCNKKFITKNHLTIHSRSHTGERPYGCSICEKSYTKSSDLVSHVRVHTGEKPFKCNVCSKSFVQNSALKVHTMRIHYGIS